MHVKRFNTNPLISAQGNPVLGGNVNGPSVIRVPDWIPDPLGKFYMYFAHHKGLSIRLAYADDLTGPWTIYHPGTLQLSETSCYGHIASPDVHVLDQEQLIKMYYHGPRLRPTKYKDDELFLRFPMLAGQRTLVAHSSDGISFTSEKGILGSSYFRYFKWQGQGYALGMPGIIFRQTGIRPDVFEQGPLLFGEDCRHFAVRTRDSGRLECFFTRVGDMPERILFSSIDLSLPWSQWASSDSEEVLRPEVDYEGTAAPLQPSERGVVQEPAQQLRDPCILQDQGRVYLFYALAGEQGIGGATLSLRQCDSRLKEQVLRSKCRIIRRRIGARQIMIPSLLDAGLSQRLSRSKYEKKLEKLQARFLHLRLQLGGQLEGQLGPPLLILFEGWDAAGKGGCIRRLVEPLDPRHYTVHQYQAPSSRDKRHHFLWRFWPAIPGDGGMCVFDRTWYGRVLVERVENFCEPEEWRRAYEEIRLFEKLLAMEGVLLIKFFLHISSAEQQGRFDRRANDPLKAWKLTEEDWRNRSKRQEYEVSIEDMFRFTHSHEAPWTVIAAETKRFARIQTLQEVVNRIEEALQ